MTQGFKSEDQESNRSEIWRLWEKPIWRNYQKFGFGYEKSELPSRHPRVDIFDYEIFFSWGIV